MTFRLFKCLDFLMGMSKIGEPRNKLRVSVSKRDVYAAKNSFYCHFSSFKRNLGCRDGTSDKFPVVNAKSKLGFSI